MPLGVVKKSPSRYNSRVERDCIKHSLRSGLKTGQFSASPVVQPSLDNGKYNQKYYEILCKFLCDLQSVISIDSLRQAEMVQIDLT